MRNALHKKGKAIELFVTYEPQVRSMCEWLKQLFGESEGKGKKGIFPASAVFSTDLHSLGQFIQDGNQCLFETVLNFTEVDKNFVVPDVGKDYEGLDGMAGKLVSDINQIIFQSVLKAHATQGGVPNIVFNIDKMDAYHLGYLIYFFMKACAFSAFIQGVYPFDQPGVEVYKENAHALLKNDE
jgi:glucose-6-phosphate isomerase